jgi:hypothetical protein
VSVRSAALAVTAAGAYDRTVRYRIHLPHGRHVPHPDDGTPVSTLEVDGHGLRHVHAHVTGNAAWGATVTDEELIAALAKHDCTVLPIP